MITKQRLNTLSSLAEGLRLKDAGLATLVDSVSQQTITYNFFRILAMHVIPYIQKGGIFQTLVKCWERKIRAYRKEANALKQEALKEVTIAYNKLAKRLENSELLDNIENLKKNLDEAKGYLDGTLRVYMPFHFQMAADALASACSLLLENRHEELVLDLVEIRYFKDEQKLPGVASCYFYSGISKIIEKRQKWGWDYFDEPHVCWSYLLLLEHCWNLKSKDFEGEQLKSETLVDCERSEEIFGLRCYWAKIQSIRNRHPKDISFFTIERFSKYLEVIGNEIFISKMKKGKESLVLGPHALSLEIFGDSLLLVVETREGSIKSPYLLHTFSSESYPYFFMKEVITNLDKDWVPLDIGMQSGSSSNLLARAKITGILRSLFIKKGKRKGSIQLISRKFVVKNLDLSTQLAIKDQLADMQLYVYRPQGMNNFPKEWTTR